ncbi:MAG TPA: CehA/McbA family metallohydrolase, partial [Anaerolineae bacterium]|nr:CehA/McbA family metallohydrolase [Anaerolineae bacterium]
VTDWAGNPVAATSWSFTTSAEVPMRAYFGDLHNHTSYSDGSLTAATAYATGRANGFDFMAVTDHSYAVDDSEWANMLTAANNATIDGVFVALRGVEYTQGAEGHINVINTVRHAVRTNTGCAFCDYTPNLEAGVTVDGFYHWLSITGTQGLNGEATIAQFNHPGWINFNDWTYHPEVSSTMKLEEVGNGNGTSYVFSEDEYIRSLDYGWKIGATNNADTHSSYWGSNTDHRTGVWLTNLTKADLMAALQARRTFATEDKNYALSLKANGLWMGSDITNTGSLAFEVTGNDPDNEGGVSVQMITFGGEVVTQTQFASSTFTWQPIVPVTPGEHYYYVKVTQPDGDRSVSSPIWAHGAIDVSLTDLTVEPTIASIYNPSLITARVTNRMAQTQTVTVTFHIPGQAAQVLTTTIPTCVKGPCIDGYASISWQPLITGPVTITAQISGTPAGDNLEDNARTTVMHVTDEHLPLILIDAAHGNTNAGGREMRMFVKDLSDHRYNVLKNLAPFTAATLNTDTVKLLVITAPETAYSSDELDAIANYAATGGSLWICGLADYTGKVLWANTVADRLNAIVDRIETRTGQPINMRLNDDEVIDGNTNNGYVFGVEFGDFPGKAATSIGVNVESMSTWSLSSIRGRLVTQPITSDTPGVQIVVQGDLDAGYSSDFYHNPYHTNNTDSDSGADAYIYNPTWVYPAAQPAGAIPLPMAAVTQLPNGGGRLMLYGDSNDGFGTFAYTAGDGKQNELFNLETVMWLLGTPVQKSTIAQARAYTTVNQPDKLNRLVWIEGKITAAFGEFFNVLYVQDETGGITIHAPAGDISATQYVRGAQVRVLGTIDVYQGDTEVEFFEAEQVQVITPTNGIDPAPVPFSTEQASLEANQGWLTQITGTVTAKGPEYVIVNDGSGPVRAFLDGYNGVWDSFKVFDRITVKGLVSEDGGGPRIRVRNYNMHVGIPNDVTLIAAAKQVYLPLLRK